MIQAQAATFTSADTLAYASTHVLQASQPDMQPPQTCHHLYTHGTKVSGNQEHMLWGSMAHLNLEENTTLPQVTKTGKDQ